MDDKHLGVMLGTSAGKFRDRIAMRECVEGEWQEWTYHDLETKAHAVARALIQLGVQSGDRVGIFSRNMPAWSMADLGTLCARAISVPIYATNTAEQAAYLINDAEMKVLFAGEREHLDKVNEVREQCPGLKHVILLNGELKESDPPTTPFSDFLRLGDSESPRTELESRLASASSEELATFIYTSGTTGEPKGVMLTHANFHHQFLAVDDRFEVDHRDRSLCFLPLSHVYERCWSYYVFRQGAQNNYLRDPKAIVEFMPSVKPTVMVAVPRLYEKIYSTVMDRLSKASPAKRRLFHWALARGHHYQQSVQRGGVGMLTRVGHALADRLVLHKIRDIVGGDKNFFSAGGAPLSQEIEEFFLSAGLLVCQGYGLTESSPMITCNSPGSFRFGTVGKPVKGCEVKIGEQGEVLARGDNIMKGYFNKPEATTRALQDGWLFTGDVGEIDDDGFLRITDRIKDLIITAGGKNIAPQRIETTVGKDHYIDQIAVIGDRRRFISALIVPFFEALETYAHEQGLTFSSREELVTLPQIHAFYEQRIAHQSLNLASYERIKRFTLIPWEFSQAGGEITPTLKIKRKAVEAKYRTQIEAMYESP